VKLIVEELKIKLSESTGKWKAEKVAIIAEFKSEFQDLSASLLAVEKELAVANTRNDTLTEDLKMTTEDFQELDAEFGEYRDNNPDKEYAEALEIDLNTVRDDLRQARERADLLEKDNVKIPEMKALADKLQVQVNDLEKQGAKQAALLETQGEQISVLSQKNKDSALDLEKARAEVDEHELRLEKLAVEKETEVSEKVSQLQALEKELARSMSQLKESQKQQQQTQGEVAQTLQSLHEAVQNNVADLERFEAEKARKIQGLEDIIAALTRDLEESNDKSVRLAEELESLRESSQREHARLQADLDSAQDALREKEKESVDLCARISSLEGELKTAFEAAELLKLRISDQETDVEDRDALIGSLERDLEKTGKSLEASKLEAARLGEDKHQLQKDAESIANELKRRDEVFALREQTLASGSEDLLKKYEEKQREGDALEAERKDLLAELEKKNAELQEKVEKIKVNEDVIESLEKSKKALSDDLDKTMEAVENNTDLADEMKKHEELAKALEADLDAAHEELEAMQHHLLQTQADERTSSEEVDRLQAALDNRTAELEEKQQEHVAVVEALEDQLMALGEELADIKQEMELEQEQPRARKPKRAAAAAARIIPAAGGGGVIDCDEDSTKEEGDGDEDLQEEFVKVQEKYVEKRAEVETLHIGLDSLLDEFKNSQNENDELVDILKSRDDMLLESVAVLEDRESALVQIKTLEDGVDNILQELMEVKGEKDEIQDNLDETLGKYADVLKRLDDLQKRNNDAQQDLKLREDAMSTLSANAMRADIEKSMQSERLASLQNELKEAQADRNAAKAEAAALGAKLLEAEQQQQQQAASSYQSDVNDIKQLVKHLDDNLTAAVEENVVLRGHSDEFKETDAGGEEDSTRNGDDHFSENIERDIIKCKQLSDWLMEAVQLVPSNALTYSTMLVQDGKSSVKRVRKAVKRDFNYLTNLGIRDDDASAITEALDIEIESGVGNVSSLFPITLSPSAPRQYTRMANGRLSLSPSVLDSSRSRTVQNTPPVKRTSKMSSLLPQESHEEEKKDSSPASLSQKELRLVRLEAQASEAARIAAAASEEADRVAQLYNRRHSGGGGGGGNDDHGKGKKKEQRREQEEVVKAQEKAYVAATRARDAFFLATTE
jgi:chromosome segregation ATPase